MLLLSGTESGLGCRYWSVWGIHIPPATVQGLLMTAYLKWRGMLETTLSLYRAAGALAGIGATLCFPGLHARLGVLMPRPAPLQADAETMST